MKPGTNLVATVEKLVDGGEGLCRVEGRAIFVRYAAPGDVLSLSVTEVKPGFARAEIAEILTPGPGRRTPPCPHFTECGGCDLQHLEDSLQSKLKASAADETIRRIAQLELAVKPRLVTGDAWSYRLRTIVHANGSGHSTQIGYLGRNSHDHVPVTQCQILAPEIERLLPMIPRGLPTPMPETVTLTAGEGKVTTEPALSSLFEEEIAPSVDLSIGSMRFQYDSRCFFQAHRGLLGELTQAVVGPFRGEQAYDLYCGVGLFTLPLSTQYERVVGVEESDHTLSFARSNAQTNGCANVDWIEQQVESWVRFLPKNADRIVVDPPRGGLPANVRRALLYKTPARVTYVSCHPAALARDLKELLKGYELEELTYLDLFPQTSHLEIVAQLVLATP